MNASKIVAAAEACLARADGMNFPFSRVAEFIEELKADKVWTDREIIEVQTAVIRELMEGSPRRQSQDDQRIGRKHCIYDSGHP